jgi:hypothetical protein
MPIWTEELREREEREYRLKLEVHTGEYARRLAEQHRTEPAVVLPPPKYDPGVYEEDIHPPGEHWVVILMPSGRVGTVKFPDELWDDAVIPNLWKRFDAKTKRRLRAI